MPLYRAYGLNLHATLTLPGLPEVEGAADAVIRRGSVALPPAGAFEQGRFFAEKEGEALLAWQDLVTVQVRGGHTVIYEPAEAAETPWLQQCLLGPPLGILFHQRGLLVLHAGAVEVNQQAWLFLGYKGAGKSTVLALLHRQGYPILSDDVVAIDMTAHPPVVLRGPTQARLWPDAVQALGTRDDVLTRIHSKGEKQVWYPGAGTGGRERAPLGAVCILHPDGGEPIQPVHGMQAFQDVASHLYGPRFLGGSVVREACFRQCAALVRAVPILRLARSPSLSARATLLVRLMAEHQPTHRSDRVTVLSGSSPRTGVS